MMLRNLDWNSLQQRQILLSMKTFDRFANQDTGVDRQIYLSLPNYISERIDHNLKFRLLVIASKYNNHKWSLFPT